jgi:hypothetical protein
MKRHGKKKRISNTHGKHQQRKDELAMCVFGEGDKDFVDGVAKGDEVQFG